VAIIEPNLDPSQRELRRFAAIFWPAFFAVFGGVLLLAGGSLATVVGIWLAAAGVSVLGLLMVSSIPYRSFKEVDLRHPFGTLVLAVVALTLVVIEPSVTLFAIGIAYAFSGPVEWLWRRATHRTLEEVPESVGPEPETTQGTTP